MHSVKLPLLQFHRKVMIEELETLGLEPLACELGANRNLTRLQVGLAVSRTDRSWWVAVVTPAQKTEALVQYPLRMSALAAAETPWEVPVDEAQAM